MNFSSQKICAVFILALICGACKSATGQSNECAELKRMVKSTYNFRPALLANDAERDQKSAAMDRFWEAVKAKPNEMVPCLRKELEEPQADPWFGFDGSALLVTLDPSDESKRLRIKKLAATNLDDVDLRIWLSAVTERGLEGFDVSEAGEHWLSYPKAHYFLPEHGAYEVKKFEGALFIFGSMDEAQASPSLIRIVRQANHPGREIAVRILLDQETTASLEALKQLELSTFPSNVASLVREGRDHPKLFQPRAKPKTTRQEFIDAFNSLLNKDSSKFFELVDQVPDGEKDVVATLRSEDLPLVRKVRRQFIAGGNQHSIEFYQSFTQIIRTMMLKPS